MTINESDVNTTLFTSEITDENDIADIDYSWRCAWYKFTPEHNNWMYQIKSNDTGLGIWIFNEDGTLRQKQFISSQVQSPIWVNINQVNYIAVALLNEVTGTLEFTVKGEK